MASCVAAIANCNVTYAAPAALGNPPGFTVFGEVATGMDVVDAIAQVPTQTAVDDQGVSHDDVPVTDVVVQQMVQD